MEWLGDNPDVAKSLGAVLLLTILVTGLWLGRQRLGIAIPATLTAVLITAIGLPGCIGARPAAQRNACINNLRMIQTAKADWANANNKQSDDVPTWEDLYAGGRTNIFLRRPVSCPRGGTYTVGYVAQKPACSLADKGHWWK